MPFQCSLVFALLLVSAVSSGAQQSEQPEMSTPEMSTVDSPATFKSRVNLVLVPVVVRDRESHAIGTLRKEDFQLFDKGKPQVISRFTIERAGAIAAPADKAQSAAIPPDATEGNDAKTAAAIPRRFVAYLFDDLNVAAGDLMRVQKAAVNHLNSTLRPADRAAILTTSGRGNQDFTDDKVKLREAVMRLRPVEMYSNNKHDCPDLTYYMADKIVNKNDQQALNVAAQDTVTCAGLKQQQLPLAIQMVQGAAPQLIAVGEQGTRVTLSVFSDVLRRLSVMPGQRTVILVSPGFLTLTAESVDNIDRILDRSASANVTISALDARGLYTPSEFDASNRGAATTQMLTLKSQYDRETDLAKADVLAELADGTGGTFFHNNNDLEAGLNRIAAAPEYVYLLGFSPGAVKPDGTFHRLKIEIQNGKGLTVQARRGYFAPKKGTEDGDSAKAEIREALYSREELHDFSVDLHTQFFKPDPADAKLTVVARVDLKRLRFKKQDGRNNDNLTIVSALFDRDGNYVTASQKVIYMRLRDETLERLSSGVTVKTSFDVKPGTYLVRLVVRDTGGQLMSAENGAVEIP